MLALRDPGPGLSDIPDGPRIVCVLSVLKVDVSLGRVSLDALLLRNRVIVLLCLVLLRELEVVASP